MTFSEFVDTFYAWSILVGQGLIGVAFLLLVAHIVRGPTLPDRVVGLDTLSVVTIGFIAIIGIDTGYTLYVDIAIALGLVGFLATVAFARFVLTRGVTEEERLENLPFRDPQNDEHHQGAKP